jgi:hypothetical protein
MVGRSSKFSMLILLQRVSPQALIFYFSFVGSLTIILVVHIMQRRITRWLNIANSVEWRGRSLSWDSYLNNCLQGLRISTNKLNQIGRPLDHDLKPAPLKCEMLNTLLVRHVSHFYSTILNRLLSVCNKSFRWYLSLWSSGYQGLRFPYSEWYSWLEQLWGHQYLYCDSSKLQIVVSEKACPVNDQENKAVLNTPIKKAHTRGCW